MPTTNGHFLVKTDPVPQGKSFTTYHADSIPRDTSFTNYQAGSKILREYPNTKITISELPRGVIAEYDLVYTTWKVKTEFNNRTIIIF